VKCATTNKQRRKQTIFRDCAKLINEVSFVLSEKAKKMQYSFSVCKAIYMKLAIAFLMHKSIKNEDAITRCNAVAYMVVPGR
jgi:hypothetical protein